MNLLHIRIMLLYILLKMFMKQSSHYVFTEVNKKRHIHFYKCLMIGILIDWLEAQGDYDLKPFVEQIFHLINNNTGSLGTFFG
ncbi:MAG: TetR/AcrR family transcriptional regulator C-terminal domain-containing protein [Faecalibacillus faecis]